MLSPEDIQRMGNLPSAEREKLQLAPADDTEGSPWQNMVNLRAEVQGSYLFWKTRGGSTLVNSFFGNILTIYPFQGQVDGMATEYIAVHTAAGNIYLWDIAASSSNQIASNFSTTEQVQFATFGRFLYMFDYDGGKSEYYDLTEDTTNTFMSHDRSYITALNWFSEGISGDNIWDFDEGRKILVFPNGVSTSAGTEIFNSNSDAAPENGLDPDNHAVNSFLYTYNGGEYLKALDGTAYKETQFITFHRGEEPLNFTVEGSGDAFTIEEYYIPLNEEGQPEFAAYQTEIKRVEDDFIEFEDPVGVTQSATIGGLSSLNDENIVFPYNADIEPLVGLPSNKRIVDGEIQENPSYETPSVYRQYVVFDMLDDGSVTLLGKPYQVEATPNGIHANGQTSVNLTLSSPSDQVEKRFLCATRWQPSADAAFEPSTEQYSNSPLFIIREINKDNLFVKDDTVDRKMLRSITELQPMNAGVSDLFGAGQISPDTIAPFTGSLLLGGYTINRPIPIPYANPTGQTDGNIFMDISATETLPNNMALAFQYEYTDGRRSDIVETEQFLQKGSVVKTEQLACDQTKASGGHEVTSSADTHGKLGITYEGITVEVELNSNDHNTVDAVAEAIRQAVNNHSTIRITANVPSGANIKYTDARFGEGNNGNVVDIEPIAIAAAGYIDVEANALPTPSPASAYFDVEANNLASGTTEDHTLTIDGNSTAAITISDTDTVQDIVDKYVAEINGDGTISADWTASKVDNGDGTWRCLIESDVNDESWNDRTISIAGDTDVTVSVDSPTSGGHDGEETHSITVGANSTADITVSESDTLESIAQKYVDAINNDGTISADWTASKVDNGDGTWRCLIDSDNPGAAANSTTISVSKSDTVSSGSEVDTTSQNATGGSDSPGVSFDTQDPTLSGATDPSEDPPTGYFRLSSYYTSGGYRDDYRFFIGDTVYQGFSVDANIDPDTFHDGLANAMQSTFPGYDLDTTVLNINGVEREVLRIRGKDGDDAGVEFGSYPVTEEDRHASFVVGAPGEEFRSTGALTDGADSRPENPGELKYSDASCKPAIGSFEPTANNLSGTTEDHVLTVDGNSTDPITIDDSMSLLDIAEAYRDAIQDTVAIDLSWKAYVESGVCFVSYRQYGTVGNGRTLSISGNSNVSVTASNSANGDDAGEVAVGAAETVNANKLQIHSLNNLVSKVYVLGRTTDGGTTFHLIDEFEIGDPGAHGKVIDLPNSEDQLDDIEADTFSAPTPQEVLETVELPNYTVVGTPFQQFQISTQESIVDQSKILRSIPLNFDADKSTMRYRVMFFTDNNIQVGYLADSTAQSGVRVFESNFEIAFGGMIAKSREGITDVLGRIIWTTQDGVYGWSRNGSPERMFDVRRYEVSDTNNLIDVCYNQPHNELWFIYRDNEVVVYDLNSQSTRRMRYGGVGNIRAGAFFGDKLYIGGGTDLMETDIGSEMVDAGGDPVTGEAETGHIGNELMQSRLLELTVGGQQFSCQVEVDLQDERTEDELAAWGDSFQTDKDLGSKTLKMHGTSYQIQAMSIMPRIRLTMPATSGGLVSHAILKYVPTENKGKARQ